MKKAPWPVASHIVQERLDRRSMDYQNERLAAVTAVVDSSAPEFADRLRGLDPKKEEMRMEKQYALEKANAHLGQRLIAIEQTDSTKILRPANTRSCLNTPGMFYSDVGGHQCIDHLNHNATSNPGSLHYRGSRDGSLTPTPPPGAPSSYRGSRGPTPMRSRATSRGPSPAHSRGNSRGPSPMGRLTQPDQSVGDLAEEFGSALALDADGNPILNEAPCGPPHRTPSAAGSFLSRGSMDASRESLSALSPIRRGLPPRRPSTTSIFSVERSANSLTGSVHSTPRKRDAAGSQPWTLQLRRSQTGDCSLSGSGSDWKLGQSFAVDSLETPPLAPRGSMTGLPTGGAVGLIRSRGPSPMRGRVSMSGDSMLSGHSLRQSLAGAGVSTASLPDDTMSNGRASSASFLSSGPSEVKQERIKSVYMTGANLEMKGGTMMAVRRSIGSKPSSTTNSTNASPARSRRTSVMP